MPNWFNHLVHTAPIIFDVVNLLIVPMRYPQRIVGTGMVLAGATIYLSWYKKFHAYTFRLSPVCTLSVYFASKCVEQRCVRKLTLFSASNLKLFFPQGYVGG